METKTAEKFKAVKLLLLDVDGVLTDGGIIYSDAGEQIKTFHVKDGLGIRLLMDAGIAVGIVTARRSDALRHRCTDLGIARVYDHVHDKASILGQILDETGVSAADTAFIGDDLPDLSIMKQVGLPIAVADAHEKIIENALWVTAARGGAGAVREICEKVLQSQGFWQDTLKRFE